MAADFDHAGSVGYLPPAPQCSGGRSWPVAIEIPDAGRPIRRRWQGARRRAWPQATPTTSNAASGGGGLPRIGEIESDGPLVRIVEFAVRWAGCLLGLFILANFVGEKVRPGFGADWIWIGNRGLPEGTHAVLAVALLWAGLHPPPQTLARAGLSAVFATYAILTAADGLAYYDLLHRGRITSSAIVCLSELLSALLLAEVAFLFLAEPIGLLRALRSSWAAPVAATTMFVLAPLVHIATYGATDYRRHADCAIVLGAQVHEDGTPSLALSDRLETAAGLYRDGEVDWLLVTGGTGSSGRNEAEAMRAWAIDHGVPADRILVDPEGTNTAASVANTKRIIEEHGFREVLVVSHGYHTPRLQLAYRRAGLRVRTVPARETRILVEYPRYLVRECLAFYSYWLTAG